MHRLTSYEPTRPPQSTTRSLPRLSTSHLPEYSSFLQPPPLIPERPRSAYLAPFLGSGGYTQPYPTGAPLPTPQGDETAHAGTSGPAGSRRASESGLRSMYADDDGGHMVFPFPVLPPHHVQSQRTSGAPLVPSRPHAASPPGPCSVALPFPQPSRYPLRSEHSQSSHPSAASFTPYMSTPVLHPSLASSSSASSVSATATPPITYPLPTPEGLAQAAHTLDSFSDLDQLRWAQDAIRLLDRYLFPTGPPSDFSNVESRPSHTRIPSNLTDLLHRAIPIIISYTSHPDSSIAAQANYSKASLLASGSCPDFLSRDPRQAFKDFESAARLGEARGWFRLGRDYEGVGDLGRAKDCFERGRAKRDCECTYRLGMAHLLGQLRLPCDPEIALPLLQAASESATIDCSHPAYVYGMLLANELETPAPIPPYLLLPSTSPAETLIPQHTKAREAIERAAYLCHPPAQYKSGFLYEHAAFGCAYDPLMSVQWYSLASQGGEVEADMALSKWFLCGAEGHFQKNEELARTFAEKAARKGHANGCFAMGYYYEVGIGGRKDMDQARKWYHKAAKRQNPDAITRLAALTAPNPTLLSVQEHESRVNDTLVRKRTLAKIRSDRNSISRPPRELQRRVQREAAMRIETERQARAAAQWRKSSVASGTSYTTGTSSTSGASASSNQAMMSPAPRVGEYMSPGPYYPAMLPINGVMPSRPAIPHQAFSGPAASGWTGAGGLVQGQGQRAQVKRDEGPATFAEMGFVSKPVQEEGCVIM